MLFRSSFALPVLAALVAAVGCSSDRSTSGTQVLSAANVVIATTPASSVTVGGSAGQFSVKVTDRNGVAVPGVLVTFSTTGALVATPASATTDASGVAVTQVTAGTVAGTGTITAVTSGVQTPVSASVAVNAGSVTSLVVSPKTLRLAAKPETLRALSPPSRTSSETAPARRLSRLPPWTPRLSAWTTADSCECCA